MAASLLALGVLATTAQAQTVLWAQTFSTVTGTSSVTITGPGFPGGNVFAPAEPPYTPPPFVYSALAYAGPSDDSNATFSLQTNAVGSQSGLLFTNDTGNPVFFAGISAVVSLPASSPITLDQIKTWQFSFDYVSNYTTDALAINSMQFWSPSDNAHRYGPTYIPLLSSQTPTSVTFDFSSLSDSQLQEFIDILNPTISGGFVSVSFQFGLEGTGANETTDAGASLGLTNFAFTSSVPEPSILGTLAFAFAGMAMFRRRFTR